MSSMLVLDKELLRINPKDSHKLEYSKNGGRVWSLRYIGTSATGEFKDLKDGGGEIFALTSKGLFYSKDSGRRWIFRSK